MIEKKLSKDNMKKGIYILPSLFTTASLFFGFYSIVSSYQGEFERAAIAILISSFFDMIDGKVARMTGTTSKFGVEYDSLSDLVSFGVAPGFLAFTWALLPFGRYGWLAGFLYIACAALRLARFNVQVETVEKSKFKGVPSPAAAGMIALTVLLYYFMGGNGATKHVILLLMIYLLAFLMVSNITYRSFKGLELKNRKPFSMLVGALLLMVLIIAEPQVILFTLGVVYISSGPFELIYNISRRRLRARSSAASPKYKDGGGNSKS